MQAPVAVVSAPAGRGSGGARPGCRYTAIVATETVALTAQFCSRNLRWMRELVSRPGGGIGRRASLRGW